MPTMSKQLLERVQAFCRRADASDVNGLDFQHIAICERRCWLHARRSDMNEWNEGIRAGLARHESSHVRDRSTSGLFGLSPDRLDWTGRIVHEEKSSFSHSEASLLQALFYAFLMTAATRQPWSVRLSRIGGKKTITRHLNEEVVADMEYHLEHILAIRSLNTVPEASRIGICDGCSNCELCWEA